jgi:hypothetical protein
MTREVTVQSHAAPIANLLAFALGVAAVGAIAIGALGEWPIVRRGILTGSRDHIHKLTFGKEALALQRVQDLCNMDRHGARSELCSQ